MTTAVKEKNLFGSPHETELIKAGTHFYCFGHCCARPIEEQSYDHSFCWSCLENRPFSDARDKALIKDGTHFYCQGHLCAVSIEEQSDDPRYCRSCCEFLRQEAESQNMRAAWVPKLAKKKGRKRTPIDNGQDATPTAHLPLVKGDIIPDHISPPSTSPANRQRIMSTSKTTGKIAPSMMVKKRRGPKQKSLPVDEIKQWAKEDGMGSKRIAAWLEKKRGIKASYKTIQRILNGQRMLEL